MEIILSFCIGAALGTAIALKAEGEQHFGAAIVCGIEFALTVECFSLTWYCLRIWILIVLLTAAAISDLENMEISDGIHITGICAFLVFLPVEKNVLSALKNGLLGAAVVGGGMLVLSLCADYLSGRETLGGGDVKLFAVVGLHLGSLTGMLAVLCSCIIGLVVCVLEHIDKREPFPFAPSIALGTFTAMILGPYIINHYLSIFG